MAGREVEEEERDSPELCRVSARLGSFRFVSVRLALDPDDLSVLILILLDGFSDHRVRVSVTCTLALRKSVGGQYSPTFFYFIPGTITCIFFSYFQGKLFLFNARFFPGGELLNKPPSRNPFTPVSPSLPTLLSRDLEGVRPALPDEMALRRVRRGRSDTGRMRESLIVQGQMRRLMEDFSDGGGRTGDFLGREEDKEAE